MTYSASVLFASTMLAHHNPAPGPCASLTSLSLDGLCSQARRITIFSDNYLGNKKNRLKVVGDILRAA